ncbi:hypothetical protein QBC35DRAFT_55703 [Podospora australis]|uniref:Uncharacterized protein n=1 Tax=Podospora australis TaxID=1536484 RepID=A0AAN6WYN5_9PEZI|nr:hypothetical protein QBC35DRAFT_55703 [Podospora australis]
MGSVNPDNLIPSACFSICNNAYLEAQRVGREPELCEAGSAFRDFYDNCNACIDNQVDSDTFLQIREAYLTPRFAEYIAYCESSEPLYTNNPEVSYPAASPVYSTVNTPDYGTANTDTNTSPPPVPSPPAPQTQISIQIQTQTEIQTQIQTQIQTPPPAQAQTAQTQPASGPSPSPSPPPPPPPPAPPPVQEGSFNMNTTPKSSPSPQPSGEPVGANTPAAASSQVIAPQRGDTLQPSNSPQASNSPLNSNTPNFPQSASRNNNPTGPVPFVSSVLYIQSTLSTMVITTGTDGTVQSVPSIIINNGNNPPPSTPQTTPGGVNTTLLITAIVSSVVGLLFLCLMGFCYWNRRLSRKAAEADRGARMAALGGGPGWERAQLDGRTICVYTGQAPQEMNGRTAFRELEAPRWVYLSELAEDDEQPRRFLTFGGWREGRSKESSAGSEASSSRSERAGSRRGTRTTGKTSEEVGSERGSSGRESGRMKSERGCEERDGVGRRYYVSGGSGDHSQLAVVSQGSNDAIMGDGGHDDGKDDGGEDGQRLAVDFRSSGGSTAVEGIIDRSSAGSGIVGRIDEHSSGPGVGGVS